MIAVFHAGLSPRSVYQRYFHITTLEQRTSQQRLALTCRVDPAHGAALVAEQHGPRGTWRSWRSGGFAAPSRVTTPKSRSWSPTTPRARDWAPRSLRALIDVARGLGVRRLYGDMFADNDAMRAVVRRSGFAIRTTPGDARVLRAERILDDSVAAPD